MIKFICWRFVILVPVLLGISLVSFSLLHLDPADPAVTYLRLSQIPPTDEAVARVRKELGLDRPLPLQYFDWLKKAACLDFGRSYLTQKPVLNDLGFYLPATLQLAGAAFFVTIIVSLPLGTLSALYKNRFIDHFCRMISFAGASMPSFWLGFLLIYLFALKLGWLPTLGRSGISHIILPAFSLSFFFIAIYIRFVRASVLENLNQRFVLYARARGIRERLVIGRHVLKNALLPVITAMGMNIGNLLAGSVIVENVFAWPGVGQYAVYAILNRDFPVVQCYILLMAIIFVVCNLVVDILYAWLDPRIRLEWK